MDPCARSLWTEVQLKTLVDLFPIHSEAPKLLSDSEGLVFRFPEGLMAKAYPGDFRSRSELLEEVEWVQKLAEKNLNVSRFLPFDNGEYVTEIPCSGAPFLACKMIEVPGVHMNKATLSENLESYARVWGQTLAGLHKFGANCLRDSIKPHWEEHRDFSKLHLIPQESRLLNAVEILRNRLSAMDSSREYGLIHADLHQGNFHLDEQGNIHIFDFDDMHQNWFLYDIAVIMEGIECGVFHDSAENVDRFLRVFLEGYDEILPSPCMDELDLFRAYRKFTLLIYCIENHFHVSEKADDQESYQAYHKGLCEAMTGA
ncbi:phosphotransferase [bacterium]|jgi:amicoumacin kinase|nr:phosphotransferase [bacterium]